MMRWLSLVIVPFLLFSLVACKTEKQQSNNHVEKGQEFLEIGDYKYALEEFDAAIKSMPRNAKAYYLKAVTLSEMDSMRDAKQSLETVLKIDPEFSDLIGSYKIAESWHKLKKKEKTKLELIRFVDKYMESENEQVPDALYYIANYEYDEGRLDQSLVWRKKIIAKFPDYRKAEKIREEIATIENSLNAKKYQARIKENPKDIEARFRLAELNYDTGNKTEGLKEIERIITIDTNYEPARAKYAKILAEKGESDKAANAYEKLILINPREADYHYELADIYKNSKDYDKAISCYKNGLTLKKDNDVLFTVAYLYQKTKRNAEAIQYYNDYILNDPLGKRVDTAKRQIENLQKS